MTDFKYDPIGPNKVVPSSLLRLADHSERGRWHTAILLRQPTGRWPGWSCEFALATVDSALQVHESDFLVRPPNGWEEDKRRDFPQEISPERLLEEALSADQAVSLLNDIFGMMDVHTNGGMGRYNQHRDFGTAGSVRATWKHAAVWSGITDHLRIKLSDHSRVQFVATLPRGGSLISRAKDWADAFVFAELAHRLLIQSLEPYREAEGP